MRMLQKEIFLVSPYQTSSETQATASVYPCNGRPTEREEEEVELADGQPEDRAVQDYFRDCVKRRYS